MRKGSQSCSHKIKIPVDEYMEEKLETISSLHSMANVSLSDSATCREEERGHDECQLCDEGIKKVANSIDDKLKEISSLQCDFDIFRIPRQLHNLNPDAYTPQLVSIGPLHCKKEYLQTMEMHKLRYLKRLLNRGHTERLDVFVKAVSNLDTIFRGAYSEAIGLGKEEFAEMMLVDGCFILELLHILAFSEKDHLVSNDLWFCQLSEDLIKLENQLPFNLLQILHGLIFLPLQEYTFSHLTCFCLLNLFGSGLHGPTLATVEDTKLLQLPEGGAKHFVDLLRYALIPSSLNKKKHPGKVKRLTFCASKLRTAGVKFLKKEKSDSPETSLFDVEFDMDKGELKIPTISIFDDTEMVLRNLIAYEQCLDCHERYFTAYAAFMDDLIDTVKDIELLVHAGIIENRLGSSKALVDLFNNITKHVVVGNSYFSSRITQLEKFYEKPWNESKAILMQNYFNTPWTYISFAAAVLLLILTIIQTACSISQMK